MKGSVTSEFSLYIKNMVCQRCIQAVEQILKRLDIDPIEVRLGEVIVKKPLVSSLKLKLAVKLKELGFELLDDDKKKQINKIKTIIIEYIHHKEDEKFIFTEVLSKGLLKDYSMISRLFSETEGMTIEQYIILQKIEKVKELLTYHEMNLNEISFKLGYSSASHVSSQFKKVTGLTPSQFKSLGIHHRKFIDGI